jgi:hypothetical protein
MIQQASRRDERARYVYFMVGGKVGRMATVRWKVEKKHKVTVTGHDSAASDVSLQPAIAGSVTPDDSKLCGK